jgi:ribosomal protein S18 acetylase RimI-like enzyme
LFSFTALPISNPRLLPDADPPNASAPPQVAKVVILASMFETRLAEIADAALISAHRRAMFADMGGNPDSALTEMARNAESWVAKMIAAEKYFGWITQHDGQPVASAGLLILDWSPHPFDPAGQHRGYLLNVFVDPEFRRKGLAHDLVGRCMAEARRRRLRVVALHSSVAGRAIYEALGFRATNEMLHVDQ